MKRVDLGVFLQILDAIKGEFEGGIFGLTAENGGITYAPFHDADIPDDVAAALEETRAGPRRRLHQDRARPGHRPAAVVSGTSHGAGVARTAAPPSRPPSAQEGHERRGPPDPRGPGRHQDVPRRHRQRGRRPDAPRGSGAVRARRERRRQEHADEHGVRALPARRGRDPPARRARAVRQLARRHRRRHRDGAPALPAHPGVHRRREHHARRRAAHAGRCSTSTRARARIRELGAQYGLDDRPRRAGRRPVGRRAAAGRADQGALPARPTSSSSTSPPPSSPPARSTSSSASSARLVEQGKSIIFITHKLREVLAVADHIVVLRGGKVVGTADPKTRHPAVASPR